MNIVYITPSFLNLKGTKGGKPNKKKKSKVEKFVKETINPNSRENLAPKKRKKSHPLKNPLMRNHIQDIDQAKPSQNRTLLNLLTKPNGSTSHVVTTNINSTNGVSTIVDDSSDRFPKCNKDSTFVEPTTKEKLRYLRYFRLVTHRKRNGA